MQLYLNWYLVLRTDVVFIRKNDTPEQLLASHIGKTLILQKVAIKIKEVDIKIVVIVKNVVIDNVTI